MILKDKIAVVFNVISAPAFLSGESAWAIGQQTQVIDRHQWAVLQGNARMGFVAILEAWEIGNGKCISN